MEHPSSSSPLRVLMRPPPPATASSAAAPIAAISTPLHPISSFNPPLQTLNSNPISSGPSTSSASSSPIGVVVVGFLGSKPSTDLTHFLNRLLDDNVFGSGNLEKDLFTSSIPEDMDLFNSRRIGYHHEPETGMVFLHFSPSSPSRLLLLSSSTSDGRDEGASSVLEECEAEDLRYMLLMFSVCHVIVFVHEGLRFDIQIFKKFRMLQAAKHALTPFLRSKIAPLVSSKQSLANSQPNVVGVSSVSAPTRREGSSSRNVSAISLMSGNGSHSSMLPGQCIPVVLFVFEDDFSDGSSAMTNVDDMTDAYRQNLAVKGSGSVVMLARPASKAESSFRKRLQSSLEAQIRFLIKKCRVLTGTDHIHSGSRGVGSGNSLPLFLLDASRVVALLDRSVNQRGEPLNFVTSLVEESLNSKDKVNVLMLENHCENLHNDDIQSVKDFILRQTDMLRGRGGLPSNVNSGSVAGVGVVAAAAAAAAASAAAGKLANAPVLPSLESWLTSTDHILEALLSLGHSFTDDIKNAARLPLQCSTTETHDGHAVEDCISCLESSKGLNMKFSVSWCKSALPDAKEVYLKDLPAYYPTSMHKTHLENALLVFNSMVKGPAVKKFAKELADECTSIWEAGRQLCDAVSLTGKPCMHRRHDVNNNNSSKEDATIQHSSGYVFRHACACGRSRRLRDDPFDFETANMTFNHFTNCENLLPSLLLSNLDNGGPLPPTYWSLRRVGGAGYYEPSKGLLQTGFCSAQKFLMKWTISTDEKNETNCFPLEMAGKSSLVSLNHGPKVMPPRNEGKKKSIETNFDGEVQLTLESQKKTSEILPSNATSISFGKGLPSFTMKKPFAEVVAGTAIADSTPLSLKQRKHTKDITDKGIKPSGVTNQNDDRKNAIDDRQASQGFEHVSAMECSIKPETNVNPYLQIGTNIVPVDICSSGEINRTSFSKQSTVYVGFEHECSYGHRFLLSMEHLKDLDSLYSLNRKQHSSTNVYEEKHAETKSGVHEMLDHYSSGKAASVTNLRKNIKLNEPVAANGGQNHESLTMFSREGMENIQSVHRLSMPSESIELEGKLSHVRLDDGSSAFSLLTRDLPVYMNCPHCTDSAKQTQQKIKFANKISQLQRIFLVTPPFPTVLATCPFIQFEESCLPPTSPERQQQSHFSFGCWVILPPESFLTLRLPFIYGVLKDDGSLQPLNHFEDKPELTAWLVKGTTLQVFSMGHESNK